MNWDKIEGNWHKIIGNVKQYWNKPSADHLYVVEGRMDKLQCKIQEALAKKEDLIKEEILPRRTMLRGALAVGCGLWLPIVFSGCDSNKGANSTNSAPSSSPASTNTTPPAATSKVSQTSVQYQNQPKGELKCSGCMNFIAESNTCKLVDGQISPNGWCSLWNKKA